MLNLAKKNIQGRIDYFTKQAIKQGTNKRVSDNTMNYVYGLKEALNMINWAELEDTNLPDDSTGE
jgi:hypothetical protein|tara:strand:+ start:758 stop:952 length:195 start_codon:yes stop_codon:yes gene_type:complete